MLSDQHGAAIENARLILTLIDLTSLGDDDTAAKITALCDKALSAPVKVAAICIYPQFLGTAAPRLQNSGIKLAAVANFPAADQPLETVLASIHKAVREGAQEIDVVFPYQKYLQGETKAAIEFIRLCKQACPNPLLLKVILETGALEQPQIIAEVSREVITAGADFLKTSTGKIKIGATLQAAKVMLQAIKESGKPVGFKASGGIRELAQANEYLQLAEQIMGADWVNPSTFRFGASQLFDTILATL